MRGSNGLGGTRIDGQPLPHEDVVRLMDRRISEFNSIRGYADFLGISYESLHYSVLRARKGLSTVNRHVLNDLGLRAQIVYFEKTE